MITEICENLHNFFCENDSQMHFGEFTIKDGAVSPLDFVKNGQYFRIVGSSLNDGVYCNTSEEITKAKLKDETFEGAIWAMNVPPSFIALCAEIEEYANSDEAKPTSLTSEHYGEYSYTRATDASGAPVSWKNVFASRLNAWRKI